MDDQLSRQMYQEHILELYKNPHNFGPLPKATHEQRGNNPLCGDDIILQLQVENEIITQAKFTGVGCALSIAAASLLTDKLIGMPLVDARALSEKDILELMQIPIGPVRIKCALLSLNTLHSTLH